MSTSTYLVTAAVMGALSVALVVYVRHGVSWHRPIELQQQLALPAGTFTGNSEPSDTMGWMLGFLLLTVVTVVLTVFGLGAGQMMTLLWFIAVIVVAFLVLGVYTMARSHGHPYSHAVGEAIVTLGAVWLVAIIGWLLVTDGRLV